MIALLLKDYYLHRKQWLLYIILFILVLLTDANQAQVFMFFIYMVSISLWNSIQTDQTGHFTTFALATPLSPEKYVGSKLLPGVGLASLAVLVMVLRWWWFHTAVRGPIRQYPLLLILSSLWMLALALPVMIRWGKWYDRIVPVALLFIVLFPTFWMRFYYEETTQFVSGWLHHAAFFPVLFVMTVLILFLSVRTSAAWLQYQIES